MGKKANANRTMDVHLLTQVADDGSPFGVEYSTRRLTLDATGAVTCDDASDALWQELAAGLPTGTRRATNSSGPRWSAISRSCSGPFLRYQYVGPWTPLVYDHRGRMAARQLPHRVETEYAAAVGARLRVHV